MNKTLNFKSHERKFKNNKYIYPVVSRRAQGLSLGINLNTNSACNWRCIYCQVPNLIRSKPEPINLELLEAELDLFLDLVLNSNFIHEFVPEGVCRFNDISLSGNGESSMAPEFSEVCTIITGLKQKYSISKQVKSILITNGSEILNSRVQEGILTLNQSLAEVWFKIDRALPASILAVNQVAITITQVTRRLEELIRLSPTFIQSCWFMNNGEVPNQEEVTAFIQLLTPYRNLIKGVLLYSVARNPALPEGKNISPVSEEFLTNFNDLLHLAGIKAKHFS